MTVSTTLVGALDVPPRLAATAQSARVVDLVQRRLRESSYYYLRTITCAFDEGVLTLRGRVPSYYLKQTVQVLAEKVEGVQQVVNLVDVMYPVDAIAI
jgi:osmotically-inducible protein OsmY